MTFEEFPQLRINNSGLGSVLSQNNAIQELKDAARTLVLSIRPADQPAGSYLKSFTIDAVCVMTITRLELMGADVSSPISIIS